MASDSSNDTQPLLALAVGSGPLEADGRAEKKLGAIKTVGGAWVRIDGMIESVDGSQRIGKIDGLAIAQSIDDEIGLLGIPGAHGNRPCEVSQGRTAQSEKAAQQPGDD
jgi:hypothetical protein